MTGTNTNLFNIYSPAAGSSAVLNVGQLLVQAHRQWCVVDHRRNFQLLALVEDPLDGTDDARRAGSKQFQQSVLVQRLQDVAHEDRPLHDAELSPLRRQLQQALPRDAGKDQAVRQRRCYQLLFTALICPEREEVHCSDLGHLVVGPVQPQHLKSSIEG